MTSSRSTIHGDDRSGPITGAVRANRERRLAGSYDRLRGIASRRIQELGAARLALRPTELVHEVYLRFARRDERDPKQFKDTGHFVESASVAMRYLLIDRLRAQTRPKHDAGALVALDDGITPSSTVDEAAERLIVDDLLGALSRVDERAATVARMRLQRGLGEQESADELGVDPRTVRRDWRFARTWLQGQLLESIGASAGVTSDPEGDR